MAEKAPRCKGATIFLSSKIRFDAEFRPLWWQKGAFRESVFAECNISLSSVGKKGARQIFVNYPKHTAINFQWTILNIYKLKIEYKKWKIEYKNWKYSAETE